MFRVGVVYKEEWPLQWESWSLIQISAQLSYRQVRCSWQTWINSQHHEPRKPNKYTTHCNFLSSNLDARDVICHWDFSHDQVWEVSHQLTFHLRNNHGCIPAWFRVQILFYFSADLGKIERIFHLNYIGGIYSVGWSRMAPRKYEIIWNRPFEGPFLDTCRCTFQKKTHVDHKHPKRHLHGTWLRPHP